LPRGEGSNGAIHCCDRATNKQYVVDFRIATKGARTRFTGPPASEELRIRRRAFIEQIVLSLDAAAEDFSEDEMSDQRTSVVKPRSRGIVR